MSVCLHSTALLPEDFSSKWGLTQFPWAADGGHLAVLNELLKTHKVDPDSVDNLGRTPLSYASELGHVKAVSLLLMQDVNVDRKDRE